jgi:hypothetical protein
MKKSAHELELVCEGDSRKLYSQTLFLEKGWQASKGEEAPLR